MNNEVYVYQLNEWRTINIDWLAELLHGVHPDHAASECLILSGGHCVRGVNVSTAHSLPSILTVVPLSFLNRFDSISAVAFWVQN